MPIHWFRPVLVSVISIAAVAAFFADVVAQTPPPTTRPAAPPQTQPSGDDDARTQAIQDRIAEVAAAHLSRTHGDTVWRQKAAVQADFEISLADQPHVAGTMIIEVSRNRIRVALQDQRVFIFDGDRAWSSAPEATKEDGVKFLDHGPFLLTAPFQVLTDGAKQTDSKRRFINGVMYGSFTLALPSNKLRNDRSHLCFWDTKSKMLRGMTFSPPGAGEDPKNPSGSQIALLDELKTVDGVVLPSLVTFWNWSLDKGVHGDQVGKMSVSNVSFIKPDEKTFAPPANAREINVTDSQWDSQ
jgi:hypothetical protein